MKTCPRCRATKSLAEFYSDKLSSDGLKSWCIACCKEVAKSAASRVAKRKYYLSQKGKDAIARSVARRADKRKAYSARPDIQERRRNLAYLRKFGITVQDYERMLSEQGGGCSICRSTTAGGRGQRFHVDHCHETGTVRGLLCHSCNVLLGHARENPSILSRAIEYLNR